MTAALLAILEPILAGLLAKYGPEIGQAIIEHFLIPVFGDLSAWAERLIGQAIHPPTALEIATKIVVGIAHDHPDDWSDQEKHDEAAEAIGVELMNLGGVPTDADINQLLELAVTAAHATAAAAVASAAPPTPPKGTTP